jgi:hypothetical protein
MAYDYTQLQADVLVSGKRPDYAGAKVQRFIAEGEVRIFEKLEGYSLSDVLDDSDRTAGSATYTMPARVVKVRHIIPSASNSLPLDQVDETLVSAHQSDPLVSMYCVRPDAIVIAGVPGPGLSYNIKYIGLPDRLANVNTNTLLQDHQLLYLNAALVSLHRETREPDIAQFCLNEMNDLISNINRRMKKLIGAPRSTAPYNTSWKSSY